MKEFSQGRNDAYQQANLAAINTAPQTFQMANALRSQPLNELNAIRTGSQVQNPTFNSVPMQATTAGADTLGATQAGYNANLASANAQNASSGGMMSGLFGLGAAGLGAPVGSFKGMFSDIRLKTNIKPLGKFAGYNWYSYDKFGKHEIGVMAQEVMQVNPDAVAMHPSGFLMVDYGAL